MILFCIVQFHDFITSYLTDQRCAPHVSGRYSQCVHCEKWIHKHSMTRHIKNIHLAAHLVLQCEHCDSLLKNTDSLNKHMRDLHGIFKTKPR